MKRHSKHRREAPPGPQLTSPGSAVAPYPRNLRVGWWSLLVFLSLRAGLEKPHGFKVGGDVDVRNETRRLMLTLAHTHGTLLAVVNIAAGLTARTLERFTLRPSVSFPLIWAALLL